MVEFGRIDHQRQAVDEADQIRPAGVERARDAELADQQEIIFAGCSAREGPGSCGEEAVEVCA